MPRGVRRAAILAPWRCGTAAGGSHCTAPPFPSPWSGGPDGQAPGGPGSEALAEGEAGAWCGYRTAAPFDVHCLPGDPHQEVAVGAAVSAVFEDHDAGGYTLVQWQLAEAP